jgi:hypothetical protein
MIASDSSENDDIAANNRFIFTTGYFAIKKKFIPFKKFLSNDSFIYVGQ